MPDGCRNPYERDAAHAVSPLTMDASAIKGLLASTFPGCEVFVTANGNHVDITVVGDMFDGLRAVQRQQRVYAVLRDSIATGVIHAVNMKTYTPAEWLASRDI